MNIKNLNLNKEIKITNTQKTDQTDGINKTINAPVKSQAVYFATKNNCGGLDVCVPVDGDSGPKLNDVVIVATPGERTQDEYYRLVVKPDGSRVWKKIDTVNASDYASDRGTVRKG